MDATFILSLIGFVGVVVGSHFRLESKIMDRLHEIDMDNLDKKYRLDELEREIKELKEQKI